MLIVNPTDLEFSVVQGGLDRVIRQAAGSEVDRACEEIRDLYGGCQTGDAVITFGGCFFLQSTSFTPSDQFGLAGALENRSYLRVVTENAFSWLWKSGIQSIAFPAISTGTFECIHLRKQHLLR